VVGRGIISQQQLDNIHHFLCEEISKHGGIISEIIACTDATDNATNRRKPNPQMLLEALEKYSAIAENTAFIGDAITDVKAAKSANCQAYLVLTGKGKEQQKLINEELRPVTICSDILAAAQEIIASTK